MLIGTDIHKVLMFVWVLLFRKLVATTLIGTYIPRVLVIDGYLFSQVYGIDRTCSSTDVICVLVWDVSMRPTAVSSCCLIAITQSEGHIESFFISEF